MSDEFQSATDNQALKDAVVSRIKAEGHIAFRDFMEIALYHPELGYYCSPGEKMGPQGDFMTSPEVSSIFGTLVGRQLREMWEIMGRPATFQIVEGGAGSGSLARDILWWASRSSPEFAASIDYVIVELSGAMKSLQRSTLARATNVTWTEALPDDIEGCVLTNELLDAFPVHRVAVREGVLHEVFVTWHDDGYFEEELRPPAPEVVPYFERLGLLPGEGCTAEVNLESMRWMQRAGRALRRGYVMTFDYGYAAADLYAPWRKGGTLLCFYRHNASSDPYSRIGKQDMTSHVDFTSLIAAGEQAGLTTMGLTTQSSFVEHMGIDEAMKPPEGVDLEGYYTRRRQVSELLDPGGLGRIKLFVQSRGVPGDRLRGLGGSPDA